MSNRVAIVTGSNKGIGFGTVRGLSKQFKVCLPTSLQQYCIIYGVLANSISEFQIDDYVKSCPRERSTSRRPPPT